MKFFISQTLAALLLLVCASPAVASKERTGVGATPTEACWNRDYEANERARAKTTCYTACKPGDVERSSDGQFTSTTTVPNHQGSCSKSKYDREYLGRDEFLKRFPKPGHPAKPASAPVATDVLHTACNGALEVLEGSNEHSVRVRAVRFVGFQWTFSEGGKLNHFGNQSMAPGAVVQADHPKYTVGIAC